MRRATGVLLGLVLVGASALWSFFWWFALAWEWPPGIGVVLFVGAMFAAGVVVASTGSFLVVGRFPALFGWTVVIVLSFLPLALLVPTGISTSRHAADVDEVATRALAERSGVRDIDASCVWEDDEGEADLWRCVVPSAAGGMCFAWVTGAGDDVRVDRCDGDDALVARRVGTAYRELRGAPKKAHFCLRKSRGDPELWTCDLRPAGGDGFCYAGVKWLGGGRVTATITVCERDLSMAVATAYSARAGRSGENTLRGGRAERR